MNAAADEWFPYRNRVEFELADFLYKTNQMPQSHINTLMGLWASSLHENDPALEPPFADHQDLLRTIDSTKLGDARWQSFKLSYSGDVPSWMHDEYEVWYRDPLTVAHLMLQNSDFDGKFDYMAFKDYNSNGERQWKDFMSGNWVWEQSVSILSIHCFFTHNKHNIRTLLQMTLTCMVQCLCQ